MGSLPYVLKSKLNYSQLALLSLTSYPYSLKLFWSPIVDSIYWKQFGRRKSWIVPIQFVLGLSMLWIGGRIDAILEQPEIPVTLIAVVFTSLVFLCATQDIAVDGWAVSLLTDENKTYASTAQTIGLNTGFFLSFTIFLALNDAGFANKYFRSTPLDTGLLSLGNYLSFWGLMFLVCTVGLLLFKTHDPVEEEESIMSVYFTIKDILLVPHMQEFMIVSLICKIGWQANEAVTALKLLDLGFPKEYFAMTALVDFPLQIIFGYLAAKWSGGDRPLKPWAWGFLGRLASAMVGMLLVIFYPKGEVLTWTYFSFIMGFSVLSSFARYAGPIFTVAPSSLSAWGATLPRYPIRRLEERT
ncbi:hypothetical protein HDU91_002244 [Kappamyces sp. JEL0680]|nr:hypothetical protein HDU91_002244 [Kappamyces sp. JEL0680]